MNAKLAKRLRAKARQLTEGLPARGYAAVDNPETGKFDHAIVHPETTRAVYRAMKKMEKRAQ